MKNPLTIALLTAAATFALIRGESATAQNAVLAELYGRGVHAYYAGRYDDAYRYLSMAIDNGIEDPRAYYFRGMVADSTGRQYEAESDWQEGAKLEASGRGNRSIGRSLARFQGSSRIKLEEIREQAKLEALAQAAARSKQRYGELGASPGAVAGESPAPGTTPPAAQPKAATPPPTPPASGEDPFADDMAQGEPAVEADDALEGAMENPLAGEQDTAAGAAVPPADSNPFGGGAAAGNDPFGGGGDAGADPFGGGGDAGADPFGGGGDAGGGMEDPFGGGGGGEDPFGGNPFGN